jgi:hypothetical protein
MKPSNLIVRVPEPCHEDWNKMLPDEKGKFCLSCNKSVFDFSNKTDTEIKNILLEHKDQKVCGHFKKSQVDRPLNIKVDINKLPANMSMTKFFAIALFVVFGSVLFSCTDKEDKVVGDLAIEIPPPQKESQEEMITMGQAIMPYVPPMVNTDPITCDLTSGEFRTAGMVYMEEYIPDSTTTEEYVDGGIKIIDEEDQIKEDTLQPIIEPAYLGGAVLMIMEPEDTEEPLKADTLPAEQLYKAGSDITDKPTMLSIFPNPSTGEFTIRYDVNKQADVRVDILDIKGSVVRTIVNVNGQYEGKYNIPVNFNDLHSEIYFVKLINNGEQFVEKVIIRN